MECICVCLPGCGSTQGLQLSGAWPSSGEEEHRSPAGTRDAVVKWGVFCTEKRNLVFNLGNGKYVITVTEKHSGGRKSWAGTQEILVFLALHLLILGS